MSSSRSIESSTPEGFVFNFGSVQESSSTAEETFNVMNTEGSTSTNVQ
jgi:hypothetical protein